MINVNKQTNNQTNRHKSKVKINSLVNNEKKRNIYLFISENMLMIHPNKFPCNSLVNENISENVPRKTEKIPTQIKIKINSENTLCHDYENFHINVSHSSLKPEKKPHYSYRHKEWIQIEFPFENIWKITRDFIGGLFISS